MDRERRRFLYHVVKDPQLDFWLSDGVWHQVDHADIMADRVADSNAGLVCSPNGEVLCKFGRITTLPEGVRFLIEPRPNDDKTRFNRRIVRNGDGGAIIQHAPAKAPDAPPHHYATTVTNRTANRIRVIKFAPIQKTLLGIKRDPMQGYYDAVQFKNWYRVPDPEGWIDPGATVCDPENYGSGTGVWAYFFEDDLGGRFISTAPLSFDSQASA